MKSLEKYCANLFFRFSLETHISIFLADFSKFNIYLMSYDILICENYYLWLLFIHIIPSTSYCSGGLCFFFIKEERFDIIFILVE